MSTGLVEQLQTEALDRGVPVAMLLRKAKLAAVKLRLTDAVRWIDAELEGYDDTPPTYREVRGTPKAKTADNFWHSIPMRDQDLAEALSQRAIYEPITSLEVTLAGGSKTLMVPLPARTTAVFENIYQASIVAMAIEIPSSSIVKIIEHVRDLVFNWALDLETAGITGSGLSFSAREQQLASTAHISIANFQGNLTTGNATGQNSRINIGSHDNSNNIIKEGNIFDDIERIIIGEIRDVNLQKELLAANIEMKSAHAKGGLLAAYQKFVGIAADHIGLFGPVIPALTALLSGG